MYSTCIRTTFSQYLFYYKPFKNIYGTYTFRCVIISSKSNCFTVNCRYPVKAFIYTIKYVLQKFHLNINFNVIKFLSRNSKEIILLRTNI